MQDYSPLEIVISDDGSTDGTSELLLKLLEKLKKDYPQFSVVLNHNEKALGMLGNREKVYSLAHGELLINVDGDDISFPSRARRFAEVWLEKEKKPMIMYCEKVLIDENDHPLGFAYLTGKPTGATIAISSSLLPCFPSVSKDAAFHAHEDLVYIERCCLLGDRVAIDEPLVFYRYGVGESTRGDYRKKMTRVLTGMISGYNQVLLDLDSCKAKIPEDKLQKSKANAIGQMAYAGAFLPLWTSKSFAKRLKCFFKNKYFHGSLKGYIACSILLLPHAIGDVIFYFIYRLRHFLRRMRAGNQDVSILKLLLDFSRQLEL